MYEIIPLELETKYWDLQLKKIRDLFVNEIEDGMYWILRITYA